MLNTNALTRIPPIVIEYGDIGRGQHLPTNNPNQMPEAALQDFENAFKAGIIKQMERKGLLNSDQAAVLVAMQRTKGVGEYGQSVG